MGAGIAASFKQSINLDSWEQNGNGAKLRQLFGAYQSDDCWAVQRKFRNIDDGDGYMSYEELHQVVGLPEFNLLLIWDIFSQQNELIDACEFLTMICIFSSARLQEKGQFLLNVFDSSQTGNCTGAEIAQLCLNVFHVLSKCSRNMVKAKDISAQIRHELPNFVPGYLDSVKERGDNVTFQKERIIGRPELDRMLSSIQATYDQMPFVGPPPSGAARPPSTIWAAAPADEVGVSKRKAPAPYDNSKRKTPAPYDNLNAMQKVALNRTEALSKTELSHLSWMNTLDADLGIGGTKNMQIANSVTEKDEPGGIAKPECTPAHSWMVLHAADFASIAKDLAGFRQIFTRSVASALGLPAECVEVINITPGSIVVEFIMRPANRGGDVRSASALVLVLEQQINNTHSAIRKGPLSTYLDNAELLAGEPRRATVLPGRNSGAPVQHDQAVQADPFELSTPRFPPKTQITQPRAKFKPLSGTENKDENQKEANMAMKLREALKELDSLRHRAEKAEVAQIAALELLKQRDLLINELQSQSTIDP